MPTLQKQLRQTTGDRSRLLLGSYARSAKHVQPPRTPIPEEDLIILEKLYHKKYPDCGRKRGAMLRYIKFFREEYETPNHLPTLIKHIKRASNEARP